MQTARRKIEIMATVQENIERMEIDFTSEWNEEDIVESCKFVCVCVSA